MKQILPGIRSIQSIPANELPHDIDLQTATGLPVSIVGNTSVINFFGVPKTELSTEYDHRYYTQTLSVTFRSKHRVQFNRPTCFVITTIDRQSYIVGTKERPFPQFYEKATTGELDGEPAGFTYEIRYISTRALRECVIY